MKRFKACSYITSTRKLCDVTVLGVKYRNLACLFDTNHKARSIWYSGGGGGGGWDLGLGQKFFSDNIGARLFFSPALRAGLFFFFITKNYIYRGFRDNFMLNNGFRDNYVLNSGFRNKFRLNSGFCHKFTLNLNFRVNCTLQKEQPDSFIVNLTLFLGSLANFTLRLIWWAYVSITHIYIIKSCLVMIIGHSNCEKGYKVKLYNISDNDHNQWRTSLNVDSSNMTRGQ